MKQEHAGAILVLAAAGMLATLLSVEIANLPNWHAVLAPAFVGKALAHVGAVLAAAVGGKLLPQG